MGGDGVPVESPEVALAHSQHSGSPSEQVPSVSGALGWVWERRRTSASRPGFCLTFQAQYLLSVSLWLLP